MGNELSVSRVEKKYDLSLVDSILLKNKLNATLPIDEHNGDNGYVIRSLYFDTIYSDDLIDKQVGAKCRRKIRLRYYDTNHELIKLERKYKEGQYQYKQSLSITKEEANMMINGDYKFLLSKDNDFAKELYSIMTSQVYVPKIIIEYNRQAFALENNETRITIDSNVRYSASVNNFFDKDLLMTPVNCSTILEVKYNNFLFDYVKDIINVVDKLELSLSKYEMACVSCFDY